MIVKPNAKINLGLNVVERRADGYHNLETIFYPIPLYDELEVSPADFAKEYTLEMDGISIDGDADDNLVIKALHLLKKEGYTIPPIQIRLKKNIPSGAGMGGGSADAAFMLRTLNELFNLGISPIQLEKHAATLGADCAIFIKNKPVYAEGIGNLFTSIDLSLHGYWLVVVKPNVFVSTGKAFSQVKPAPAPLNLRSIITRPIQEWRGVMVNDFEASVFPQFPEIATIKTTLYQTGALYASMSGSGSSLYGIYAEKPQHVQPLFTNCFFQCFEL